DGTTPTLTLSVAQIASDSAVLDAIVSAYHLSVTDTAANIRVDLAAGASSHILHYLGVISGITLSSGTLINLTEAQATYAGVDGGAGSALALTSGLSTLVVTNVTVAQIPTVTALHVAPTAIQIADSVANIVADLAGANTIGATAAINRITPTDSSANVADTTAIYTGIAGGVSFIESGLTITDTAANLLGAYILHPAMLTAAASVT